MSIESARQLVTRLKNDSDFRHRVIKIKETQKIWQFIISRNFDCTPQEVQEAYNRYG